MKDTLLSQQTKKLFGHMKDYVQAEQVSKKAESAIFDKHRLPDGGYNPEMRDELQNHRKTFNNEWGISGWRNQAFVKKQIEEAQRPTEEDLQKMQQAEETNPEIREDPDCNQNRQEFLDQLNSKRKNQPKPRMG